jgi:hypothetical protein
LSGIEESFHYAPARIAIGALEKFSGAPPLALFLKTCGRRQYSVMLGAFSTSIG